MWWARDKVTDKSAGYAVVTYDSAQEAKEAVSKFHE